MRPLAARGFRAWALGCGVLAAERRAALQGAQRKRDGLRRFDADDYLIGFCLFRNLFVFHF